MTAESDRGSVARDAPGAFDDGGVAGPERVAHLPSPVMTVYAHTQPAAFVEVALLRRSHDASGDREIERRALENAQRLARIEAQLGIEAERAAMVRRLHQPHAGEVASRSAFHHGLHQAPADRAILDHRVHGYRS